MTEEKRYINIVPSERQVANQLLEFYGFIHFSINTFTNREWGDGTEDISIFNPKKLDTMQWAETLKGAGMKGLILTCKHHDGFCLWPSKYTRHTVAATPYKDGRGDIVREVSDACRKVGLKFGIYLSPWDRNNKNYGHGEAYNTYFINQLTELLTGYGDIFCIWFDGACGEGSNGKKQRYSWDEYYETIRQLQPKACISVCGPDVRWIGNEGGKTRGSEWSVVPARLQDVEKIQEDSQHESGENFRLKPISSEDVDLGSQEILKDEPELIWYPAEVDMSIRPGWFYHKEEDARVISLERLKDVYLKSVGGNATLLLNIPPTPEGLIAEPDRELLRAFGDFLRNSFAQNILCEAEISASGSDEGHDINMAFELGYDTYYKAPDNQRQVLITIKLPVEKKVEYLVLQENIHLSQRIEEFTVSLYKRGILLEEIPQTIVGYKKVVPLHGQMVDEIRIQIRKSRVCPTLAFLGMY